MGGERNRALSLPPWIAVSGLGFVGLMLLALIGWRAYAPIFERELTHLVALQEVETSVAQAQRVHAEIRSGVFRAQAAEQDAGGLEDFEQARSQIEDLREQMTLEQARWSAIEKPSLSAEVAPVLADLDDAIEEFEISVSAVMTSYEDAQSPMRQAQLDRAESAVNDAFDRAQVEVARILDDEQVYAASQMDRAVQFVTGGLIALIVIAAATAWFLYRRARSVVADVDGVLTELDGTVADLASSRAALAQDAERRRWDIEFREGLELADDEITAIKALEDFSARVFPDSRRQLMLADSSLSRFVTNFDDGEVSAACNVEGPNSCPAVRRSRAFIMTDSEATNACPRLRERGPGLQAVCGPIAFGGTSSGVIHLVAERSATLDWTLAVQVAGSFAARLGSLRAFDEAQMQASIDSLTGLLNRRATELLAERKILYRHHFAVAMIDLDDFKLLNDTHGHAAGDAALRAFGATVLASLREKDSAGRIGGEEFLLVFDDGGVDTAVQLVARLRDAVNLACQEQGLPAFTFSAGVAETFGGESLAEIRERADQRLLEAKQLGKNRTVAVPGRS